MKYKAKELGKYVVYCDRFSPSSKQCSKCEHKHTELKLSDRMFVCPNCNLTIDRDLNSAINLQKEGLNILMNTTHILRYGLHS